MVKQHTNSLAIFTKGKDLLQHYKNFELAVASTQVAMDTVLEMLLSGCSQFKLKATASEDPRWVG